MHATSLPPPFGLCARRPRHKRALVVAGVALVVLGVALGVLPVVPGTPLTLLGVALATTHSPRLRLLRQRTQGWLFRRGVRLRLSRRRPRAALAAEAA